MPHKKQDLKWRKLDNSAKIFPIISNKKYSSIFRLSAVLKEEIEKESLEKAVKITLEKFPFFKVTLKKGVFWYYFEDNPKEVVVEEEHNYPCKYIDKHTNHGYLFKITYFKTKINMDVFHSLTDGNSAGDFFKEIIYTYLELEHQELAELKLRKDKKRDYSLEDSYMKNYDKKSSSNASSQKAYLLKGKNLPFDAISVIHEIIQIEDLKRECTKMQVTITQYLTSVLILCIYKENAKENLEKKPIKICIPVNLKKYFDSNTISNFFSYITLEAGKDEVKDFETIVNFVKQDFEKRLQKEEILKTMSANVKIGNNILIRFVPLFLKRIMTNLSYIEIRKYTTTTFSNIGRIGIMQEYRSYIDNFFMLIAPESVERIKCSACSYEDKITMTFTSVLQEIGIQKAFYEFLTKQGIHVKIQTNEVPYVISEDFQ